MAQRTRRPLSVSYQSHRLPRMVRTSRRCLVASGWIVACWIIALLAMVRGIAVPADGWTCLLVMGLAVMPIYAFFARRLS